ncbi:F-box domain-containing protein [Sodiomyces alkalinus F11]|uniref:F-box domain-containing protein n=1 Tax=Sodiomyces alkalinus (strain CBS 110278 / VKM F-3762 / F11) TaxID=1314773 RepID=A0A3N2QA84_SODAK|nr:F-box domain-containing protein [Sodiomyces alkalinus F11]ROT43636.1 F-box domain-containing protein [Sodiomyces alkalinus F11]
MAPERSGEKLSGLPDELVLRILSFLEPHDFPNILLTSRKLRQIALDNNHWRSRVFDQSHFLESLERRRHMNSLVDDDVLDESLSNAPEFIPLSSEARKQQRLKDMANWDPTLPGESVLWYDEYIQRYAPSRTNWFQQPRIRDGDAEDLLEVLGLAVYEPPGEPDSMYAVSPLDDGSICLWDVKGRRHHRKGAMLAKSRPGILHIDGPGAAGRSRKIDTGVTESITVDSYNKRAFVAVQSHLMEVDLERLAVVSDQSFEWSIATLSSAHPDVPLTVGTTLGIHIFDHRARVNPTQNMIEQIFDPDPLPKYAALSQPHPLSILHLPRLGDPASLSDDIFVAGRFSNILHYDRRYIQPNVRSIQASYHSGARLSCLTSLPGLFSPLDSEVRRRGELSVEQVRASKAKAGQTLIAGGEYNSKGSLELYGLSPSDNQQQWAAGKGVSGEGRRHSSNFKNRYNAAESKILSIASHGTRVAFSDGSGYVRWFERDGFTEVHRHRIGHSEVITRPSIFSQMPGLDDLARKILPTGGQPGGGGGGRDRDRDRVNDNDLLFWTGEKLGMITFGEKPGFQADDFEEEEDVQMTEDETKMKMEERNYGERMRLALEREADSVRFVRGLGLGVHP